jgi:putative addiction module killer protein
VNTIETSSEFDEWLRELAGAIGKARIVDRVLYATAGNFGDWAAVGDGVLEMRIDVGPGYRVYYTRTGKTSYSVLCAGTKRTQKRDITHAIEMAKRL